VGEARAALAEAVAVLQHLANQARARASVLGEITMALDFQDFSGQVVKKLLRTIGKPST
jgi:chemotaxis regulatin CheY-phosphate phosphatase CheZ